MTETPTWNGRPVAREDLAEVTREAFDICSKARHGARADLDDKRAALHLLEASAHLKALALHAERLGVTYAHDAHASWRELGAAMGITGGSVRGRHWRATRRVVTPQG
ncbi:hypothetical protein GO011_14675 [Mycobacterium sp. 20091114027_K0903767]|nr:hypothetical protein [Mycobacterium sp. 20091114027_K0903767]